MPTRSDDQQPSHRTGMAAQDGSRDATPLSVSTPLTLPNESEVVYELRDDDFILVDPDETIEFQTSQHLLQRAPPPPPRELPQLPPLPPWAAASRSVLDGWNGESSQAAIELREAREDLVRFARQTYAREVYVQEVERALAAAHGRVRGQAFRIAELEQALRASEAEALRVARPQLKADSPQLTSQLELRAADAESLRAMLELDLRALQAEPSVLDVRAGLLPPSAADGSALVSLREYVARVQSSFARGVSASFAPGQYIVEAQTRRRAAPKRRTAQKSARPRDDLQRIKGIGPSMAERLAKAGVKSFESIARWKAKDLERMADKLGVSRARIERQAWVKQARSLSKQR